MSNQETDRAKILETMLNMVTGFLILFAVFRLKIFLTISVVLSLTGLFSGYLSKKIHFVWMKIATLLGYINGRILLSVVFFLFLTPIAFFSRLKGKSSLYLKKDDNPFVERNHTYVPEDFENTW